MVRRFSRLDYGLKLLRRPTDVNDPTATAPAAPAGSTLAEYEKFAARKKFINITRAADSLPTSLVEVTLIPFGLPDVAGSRTMISFSRRSQLVIGTYGGTAAYNHEATNDGTKRPGFKPAKAIVFDPGTAAVTSSVSQITGVAYKRKKGKSYTFPFGKGAGTDETTEFACRTSIVTAVQTAKAIASVSFKSEDMKYR